MNVLIFNLKINTILCVSKRIYNTRWFCTKLQKTPQASDCLPPNTAVVVTNYLCPSSPEKVNQWLGGQICIWRLWWEKEVISYSREMESGDAT